VDFKLVWTPLARDDLREIVRYVGERILSSVEPLKGLLLQRFIFDNQSRVVACPTEDLR